jgi:hypothetical protein
VTFEVHLVHPSGTAVKLLWTATYEAAATIAHGELMILDSGARESGALYNDRSDFVDRYYPGGMSALA